MNVAQLEKIRKLAVISLFSDDTLMDIFVLKGGSALNLVYDINSRASIDIDVSMEEDFGEENMENIKNKLKTALDKTFAEEGLCIFDVSLSPKPLVISTEKKDFWGGYVLEFKVIESEKYEYCKSKKEVDLEGYTIYVYTPIAIVYEKLRAICQQMEEYTQIVQTNRRPRARDFYDIYTILSNYRPPIDIADKDNLYILERIFAVKKVPLELIGKIEQTREFHKDDFFSVKDTIAHDIEDFDYYFDYVVEKTKALQSLWIK
jgi:predicted nucleotidyltransferase component of viral defense system